LVGTQVLENKVRRSKKRFVKGPHWVRGWEPTAKGQGDAFHRSRGGGGQEKEKKKKLQ